MTSLRPRGRPPHDDVLTPAEWRVVELVRHGLSNPAIAKRAGVSIDAVKFHLANALAKLGFASRAEIRRWDGISRASPLSRKEPAMADPVALGAIGQIARNVRSIAESIEFYGTALALPHLFTFGNLAFFDCGGTRLFLSEGDGGTPGPESILYFQVPDIHAAYAGLGERGVTFTDAPHCIHRHADGTEEWMCFFSDPEGRPLAIIAQAKG